MRYHHCKYCKEILLYRNNKWYHRLSRLDCKAKEEQKIDRQDELDTIQGDHFQTTERGNKIYAFYWIVNE